MRRLLLLFCLATATLVATAGVAYADGATVEHIDLASANGCFDDGTSTLCQNLRGRIDVVTTPNGQASSSEHESGSFTITCDPRSFCAGFSQTTSIEELRFHLLTDGGAAKEFEEHASFTVVNNASGAIETCLLSIAFHETSNPRIGTNSLQYDRLSTTCSP